MINISVLFIGDLNPGTRSFMRYETLKTLVNSCDFISNTVIPFNQGIDKSNLYSRFMHKIGFPTDATSLNKHLIEKVVNKDLETAYDIIWIEKTIALRPRTLRLLRNFSLSLKIISVSEDDMYASHNRSKYYDKCLNFYDIVFTTKKYNLTELISIGAKQTEFFLDSFDEKLHKPMKDFSGISQKNIDVSFIGTYEDDRFNQLFWLAKKGIRVCVFGSGWEKYKNIHENLIIHGSPIYSKEYVKIINQSKINLGFLRKINRDVVTSRSIEIPACSSFLLAERTEAHKNLFIEGVEADFFSSKEELYEKIKFYLSNKSKIIQIGKNARKRCIKSGYSMKKQLISIIDKVRE